MGEGGGENLLFVEKLGVTKYSFENNYLKSPWVTMQCKYIPFFLHRQLKILFVTTAH